jgi:hypothetical protein
MNIVTDKLLFVSVLAFSIMLDAKTYKNVDSKFKKYTTHKQKKELFKNVGCNYSNIMKIDSALELIPPYQTQYFKDNKEIILELSEKYKNDVEKRILAQMYLEFISPVVGYGIKAAKPIKAGDFIGVYTGLLRNLFWNDPNFKEDVDYAWYYTVSDKNDENMIVDGKYEGNELRFINHANNPNTKRIDVIVDNIFYICYVATKDIAKDEELTVSYGDGYWSSRGVAPESLN